MGGNDTHDKYGRPYELDDSKEFIYDKLENFREASLSFQNYMEKEINELNESTSNMIELAQTREILYTFHKIFSDCDY